jgi:hypothetical protein
MENLLVYYWSQSRMAADIFGSCSPGANYTTLRSVIFKESKDKIVCPDGDIIIAFDSNQVLSRNWSIRPDATMPVSCITSVCCTQCSFSNDIRASEQYSPSRWPQLCNAEKLPKYDDLMKESTKTLPEEYDTILVDPLDCFHLKPGNGHIEMNLLRCIFKLLWVPCLQEFVKALGFRSDKAQDYVLNDRDHHISWQILTVCKHY